LEALFEGLIEPYKAVITIASLYNLLLRQGFIISPVFKLWGMICKAIRMLNNNINIDKRLLELLNEISTLLNIKDQSGKAINAGGGFPRVY